MTRREFVGIVGFFLIVIFIASLMSLVLVPTEYHKLVVIVAISSLVIALLLSGYYDDLASKVNKASGRE